MWRLTCNSLGHSRGRGVHGAIRLAQIGVILIAHEVSARTWTVEKDGSGDFTVIQDALDAAASGDTVQIGPGRFEEWRTFQLPGGLADAYCRPTQNLITVIGSGSDVTIIGKTTGPGSEQEPWGFLTAANTRIYIRDLTVENVNDGVQANGPYVSLQNCLFRGCWQGLSSLCWVGTLVQHCTFINSRDSGVLVLRGLGATNVLVEDSQFMDGGFGIDLQSQGSLVRRCQFSGQVAGIQLSFGAQATIEDCAFEGSANVGVVFNGASRGTVRNSQFGPNPINLNVQSDSQLIASGNIFGGGTLYTVRFTASTTITFYDNHVFNGGGWSAYFGAASVPTVFDVRNNWWGTTDPQQIDNWIRDDEDGATNVTVLFVPFHGMPVSTRESSFGSLKSRFGNDTP